MFNIWKYFRKDICTYKLADAVNSNVYPLSNTIGVYVNKDLNVPNCLPTLYVRLVTL